MTATGDYLTLKVALLAEGVDRNLLMVSAPRSSVTSPSSRRAWIEIRERNSDAKTEQVALLAEGVDRNGVVVPVIWNKRSRPPRGGRG